MNIHFISCQVFYRELSYLCALCENQTSISWLPQGLHDTPNLLRKAVSDELERLETAVREGTLKHNPDVIVLGYGLCSNGTAGLISNSIPIVVPRTDDCIGVFLGSQKRYLEMFSKYSGTYWLNNGWIETAFIPTKENYEKMRAIYAEHYDEDNADYLMEQETLWIKKYTYCGYINSPIYKAESFLAKAKGVAEECGWGFFELEGSLELLEKMVGGEYDEKLFLTCPPQHKIVESFDELKFYAEPI